MNKKTFLKCYVCALFFATAAYAESGHSMKGTVADANGKPLSGVLVQVPGTKIQVLTDADGRFDLPVEKGTLLNFVHPDFYAQEVAYKGQNRLLFNWLHECCRDWKPRTKM
ncbi:carboxypeptidase-like regulatory domain-containing protein [Bacteroides thetaiotaomicron]|uniref:carboxypeptidase-like regulatory domain-containing protein n=1 Tax=Bacteroides thetaiotaomicron TaxID=818 RepID=UPI0021643E83|nr:carboxypeptidase-like regulatory domain-containing protein [Bacteroides thetaiotaomicron]UVR89239.1 carboxypeptidase-like regulatory domain-containing protein [Bacteroides thetaiotaomicron]